MPQAHPSGSSGSHSSRGGPAGPGQPSAVNVSIVVLATLVLLSMLTGGGRSAATQMVDLLRYYGGVFTLVSLTLTVIAGLIATDRIILVARHRTWVQSVHRTLGIVAVSCLALHIGTELIAGRVGVFGLLVPFVSAPFEVGLGTVAAYLMLTVMWTGVVRARFAQDQRAWLWRPLHVVAYLCWPMALLHGLSAGRPPAGWVTASYLILLFLAVVALGLRLSAERNRRQQRLAADRSTTSIAPVGRPMPANAGRGAARSAARRFRWDAPPAERSWLDAEVPYRNEPMTTDTGRQTRPRYPAPAATAPTIRIPRGRPEYTATAADQPGRAASSWPDSAPSAWPEPAPSSWAAHTAPAAADPVDLPPQSWTGPTDSIPVQPAGMTLRDRLEARHTAPAPAPAPTESAGMTLRDRLEARHTAPAPAESAGMTLRDRLEARHTGSAPASAQPGGMTLRDRFEVRRSKVAEATLEDRYIDDNDTPTLVNLDSQRAMRRKSRDSRDPIEDDSYWAQLRGEAR